MARPPSKHGLEKKFKSWRKGKSKNSKSSSSSLKHQLRGHERLLLKIPETETERRTELEEKIAAVKLEISDKERSTKERDNATKSHGIRFLERQRLTRLEKKAKNASDKYKIALDQIYVAHFPHDIKYLPLFRKGGERCIDNGKTLFRRSITRNRIFKQLQKGELQRVDWVSAENYKLIPSEWTTQLERDTFGTKTNEEENEKAKPKDAPAPAVDNRFSMSANHEQVLLAAEVIENELNQKEENVKEDDASSIIESENSDDEDDADPMAKAEPVALEQSALEKTERKKIENLTKGDSEDGRSSASSSSSDSSDSSSDHDSEDEAPVPRDSKKRVHGGRNDDDDDDDDDDFFMPVTDENVFEKAKMEKASDLVRSGDKSSGWATQRQRPGKWQPKKQRR